jgi:hypothetical protein
MAGDDVKAGNGLSQRFSRRSAHLRRSRPIPGPDSRFSVKHGKTAGQHRFPRQTAKMVDSRSIPGRFPVIAKLPKTAGQHRFPVFDGRGKRGTRFYRFPLAPPLGGGGSETGSGSGGLLDIKKPLRIETMTGFSGSVRRAHRLGGNGPRSVGASVCVATGRSESWT